MKWLDELVDRIGQLEKAVGVFLVLAIVAMIAVQVVTRYFFDQPLAWVEELATYAFIWTVFIGASYALKGQRHISIEAFQLLLSARSRVWLQLFIWCSILVFLVVVIPQAFKVMSVESRSKSVSLPIDIPRMWFYSFPLALSCCSMLITSVQGVLNTLSRLMKPPKPGAHA
jgi:TRAP-type C4-dicarboxylate transport system permease small subunit